MKEGAFHLFFLFFLLIFLQISLFNDIHLFGLATPLLYIYFVIKLPVNMNRNLVLILSAVMGLLIDLFGYTLGLNMFAMVIVGFFRYYLLKLFIPKDVFDGFQPSFSVHGKMLFMRYAGTIALIHVTILYSVESLALFDLQNLLLRIAGSFTLTVLFIFAFENIKTDLFKR